MRKRNFLMLIFGLMLSVSGYSQTSILEHLLFQGAYYQALFPYHDLAFSSYKNTDYLNMIKLGAAWEQPVWKGLGLIGLESGYSSGSKFGGKSDMDFIPIILNMGYNFLLGDFFSVGPNLKLGGFAILTPIGNQIVPMIAGHLEGEFRYRPFPLSLYVAGGVDFFPTVAKGYLPAFEAGLRFRPFALTRAGKEKNEAYSQAGGQSGSQAAGGAALNQDGTATGTGAAALSQGSGAASQGSTAAGLAPVASAQGAGTSSQGTIAAGTGTAGPRQNASVIGQGSASSSQEIAELNQDAAVAGAGAAAVLSQLNEKTSVAEKALMVVPVVIEGRQGRLRSAYFEPDTEVLIEASRPALDAVGQELAANPSLRLHMQAYTAPVKTPEGRLLVSRERATFCQEYFTSRYGIAPNRMTRSLYGSEKTPLMATDDMESLRCVELIILE